MNAPKNHPALRKLPTLLTALLALALLSALAAGPAEARKFAPLDQPGPKLRVQKQKLRESLQCTPGVRDAERAPVLFVPATGVNFEQNFSWNYANLMDQNGIPWCSSDQPGGRNSNQTDIQLRGQYLTFAIRKMHRMADRKISIIGHSQGGMAMRWSLRFWPDTREMVDDVIGFAATNHGTTEADGCLDPETECTPASHQQASKSDFTRALNSRAETFEPISYTEVLTTIDQTVKPQPEASSLPGPAEVTNIAIQDICPNARSEHLMVGTVDPPAAALALDALDNPGPADPSRISPLVCAEVFHPGVDPVDGPAKVAAAIEALYLADSPTQLNEPKLRCYVLKTKRQCRQAAKAEKRRS